MASRWQSRRLIVVGLLRNRSGECLLCKMPADRGVFPGAWSLPGGGVEPGESIDEALRREIREELGLELERIEPLFFRDLVHEKLKHGTSSVLYMVFLVFGCTVREGAISLSEEFERYAWVPPAKLTDFVSDEFTLETLRLAGLLSDGG